MKRLIGAALVAAFFMGAPASAGPIVDDPVRLASLGAGARQTAAGGPGNAVAIARRYLGGNPTGRRSQWCADFLNLVERKAGREGTGSRLARSYLGYGRPVADPRPGDIVVLWRGSRRGTAGHVGYFLGWKGGRLELLSGNHGRRVAIATYPRSRVLGYRRP